METSKLKKFAQYARRSLIDQVGSKLEQVIKDESAARRELPQVVEKLDKELARLGQGERGKELLVEQVAYIWFNRFCALRFMDANAYNRIGVLSPIEGQFQPEILAEAKAGHIDEAIVNDQTREKIFGLLNGSIKSRDGQVEAYHLLIVAVCNDYHRIMPYLFERIEDYTELLMPDDLLSGNSILAYTREAMTPEACESVECIGWLYQFYVSEKKDQVFADLKKNKKITPENIPAATQLFTPHWIVRYLVENSLGRLWMLNNPSSKVIEKMDYYIKPVEIETDFLRISSPEEIKICDPACGSGHMLTYAYDLLYAIYLDAEYDPTDIPELILTNNLYGIEIDERAAELAAFALTMKAVKGNPRDDSNNRRRFFRNPIKPNICRLEKITFSEQELDNYIDFVGRDLFTQELRTTLKEFEEADNFGSLIQPTLKSAEDVLEVLEAKDVSGQLFLSEIHKSVLRVLKQTDYLSQKYHVVVANPPYMGGKGMNPRISKWLKDNYPDVKSDLFSAFIVRNTHLALNKGQLGFMTPFVWMFISSYEKLRSYLINNKTISSLIQLEYSGFDGATVPICTFTIENSHRPNFKGGYIRLSDFKGAVNQAPKALEAIQNYDCGWFFRASSEDFNKVPGSPIAYWITQKMRGLFQECKSLGEVGEPRLGMATGNNDLHVRYWSEVSLSKFGNECDSRESAKISKMKWFPYNKGGAFRRWYGNNDNVVNWENDGDFLQNLKHPSGDRIWGHNFNLGYIFKSCLTFTATSSSYFGIRYSDAGFLFDNKGSSYFSDEKYLKPILGFLASKPATLILKAINPTIEFQPGNISVLPFIHDMVGTKTEKIVDRLVEISRLDWDQFERSWSFNKHPLFNDFNEINSLSEHYIYLRNEWKKTLLEMKSLEQENNEIFIDLYGLDSEISANIPINELTISSNPSYRWGAEKCESDQELLLRNSTMQEFISYTVGCMFGRYSLDKEGLILASQGDTLVDYLKQVPQPSFEPDDDNAIPLIDFEGDWFEDDISERFKQFLKVTFGEDKFSENLAFIEDAIGKNIKKYFVKDFYIDHVKRYKKRPIYWMFSSPNGSFNALIYMHRYQPDTVSVVLNDYLREFRAKLIARKESYEQVEISTSASPKEKTQAIKSVAKINKVIDEVNDYERDILYPLAGKNIKIDLDDGVKHNYPLFGKALKKVTGLS